MISYSTNWMGPVSNKWYEDSDVQHDDYTFTTPQPGQPVTLKRFTDSYSGGRIDIYGLDEEEYYCGKHEYGIGIMLSEDWNALSDWLTEFESEELVPYDLLIEQFETHYKKQIRWRKE